MNFAKLAFNSTIAFLYSGILTYLLGDLLSLLGASGGFLLHGIP
jgi:hypothetical protein